MGSLSSAKTLGGVGGILVFFPFLSLVGWILILLATKEISETVQDKTIFDDALLAAITAVIGAVVFSVFVFSGAIGGLFLPGPFGHRWSRIPRISSHPGRVLGLYDHIGDLSKAL